MSISTWSVLAVFALAACSTSEATPAATDPCSAAALKLGSAAALTPWTPPQNCSPVDLGGRAILATKADFAAHFKCQGGDVLGLDPANAALLAVSWEMSPAATGMGAFDDGKLVTLVTHFRKNCPGEQPPRPVGHTDYFLLPAATTKRTFAEANCSYQPTCK